MTPSRDELKSLPEWIRYGEQHLVEHGVPNARNNAEWILCDLLECDRLALYTSSVEPGPWQAEYRHRIERRAGREPLQYIIGSTEFMSLPCITPSGVFVPRPETEVLVEAAERNLRTPPPESCQQIADLCCGSGIVAVSLAVRLPGLRVDAVDLSPAAVETTSKNASLNGVLDRVRVIEADAIAFLDSGEYSAILCNPPYIATGELCDLPPEVRDHEPVAALDGGIDGLDFYRSVVLRLLPRLQEGGFVGFEIGATQAPAVSSLLRDAGFTDVTVIPDLSNLPRVILAWQ